MQDQPAVVILHLSSMVPKIGLGLVPLAGDLHHRGPFAIPRRGEDHAVGVDGGRAVRRSVRRSLVAPQVCPVAGQEAQHPLGGELHVLPLTGHVDRQNRGIPGAVTLVRLAPPDLFARQLVEGDHGRFASTRGADHPVAVDQHRLADAPVRNLRLVILHNVVAPDLFAIGPHQADQVAGGAHGVQPLAINRGGPARTIPKAVLVRPRQVILPGDLAIGEIHRQHILAVFEVARRVQHAASDAEARETDPQPRQLRHILRPPLGPGPCETRVGRMIVPGRSQELRQQPVRRQVGDSLRLQRHLPHGHRLPRPGQRTHA